MTDCNTDLGCAVERRECAITVRNLEKAVVRQVTITEERIIPTLDRIDATLVRGDTLMKDHEIRLVNIEGHQKRGGVWSRRGWIVVSALFIGVILAAVRSHLK